MLTALERPQAVCPASLAAALERLRAPGLSAETCRHLLSVLASIAYSRPDLIGKEAANSLRTLLGGPPLPEAIYDEAGEVLNILLTTPAADHAIEALFRLLSSPNGPETFYATLLRSLHYAALWAITLLDLTALVSLAEHAHLTRHRERLLHEVIERALFSDPSALTPELL